MGKKKLQQNTKFLFKGALSDELNTNKPNSNFILLLLFYLLLLLIFYLKKRKELTIKTNTCNFGISTLSCF